MSDLISRQAAIDFVGSMNLCDEISDDAYKKLTSYLDNLPSAQPTLHGYNVKHLELIARILQKEDVPPERVAEALTDIGRVVAIVQDEFVETLRRTVQNIERRNDE